MASPAHLTSIRPTSILATPTKHPAASAEPRIREVWADNLEKEMGTIRELIIDYPYVAMDTEFPGVVARPLGTFKNQSDFLYQTLRCNVDLLRLIQLGLTLANSKGQSPHDICTWQFNFKFSLTEDTYAQDSIDLLMNSGLNFRQHALRGIDVADFGELLITSGLVLMAEVRWITFHSGYDFGYLLKVLTCAPLPAEELEFFKLLKLFFPAFFDIKFLLKQTNIKGGLQDLADELAVGRIGFQHQAGSDSHLTMQVFFALLSRHFSGKLEEENFVGRLYGIGPGNVPFDKTGAIPTIERDLEQDSETNASMISEKK